MRQKVPVMAHISSRWSGRGEGGEERPPAVHLTQTHTDLGLLAPPGAMRPTNMIGCFCPDIKGCDGALMFLPLISLTAASYPQSCV